jgi:hypothetical protein
MICPTAKAEYFLRKGLDRKFRDLPVGPISRHVRPVRDGIAAMSATGVSIVKSACGGVF